VTFEQAVEETPGLAESLERGLRGLRAADRPRVRPANSREVVGSVDLDGALAEQQPNAPRWDYAIGYGRNGTRVYWLEVHPATDGDVGEVLRKLSWLKDWLTGDGRRLAAFPAFLVWVASEETTFTPNSPARRRLAQAGVDYAGRSLDLA
jgi:hypothetical protein